jgi:hypothetical protein
MWDFLIKIVDSVPPWFLMALIVFLAAAAIHFLPRIRRDKNGKPYVYSRSYEHQKNRLKEHNTAMRELKGALDDADDKQGAALARIETRVKSVELEDLKQSFYLALLTAATRYAACPPNRGIFPLPLPLMTTITRQTRTLSTPPLLHNLR